MNETSVIFEPRILLTPNFVKEYVATYKSQAAYPKEAALEERLKANLAGRDFMTKDQLLEIAQWKAPRIRGHIEKNDPDRVIEISKISFTSDNERTKIEILLTLEGVQWPVASTILHFRFPDKISVIDFRALWTLGIDKSPPYDFGFWKAYNDFILSEASHLGVSVRELDMALWAYSKRHQHPLND